MKFFFSNFYKKKPIQGVFFFNSSFIKLNAVFIPFFKKYKSLFYFFIPLLELDYTNFLINKTYKKKIWLQKIRYKPGYQVIWRYYRKKWAELLTPYNYRQKRLTHTIYIFSVKNTFFYNIYFKNSNNISFNDPSKHLLNWKYIV